jgi:hypothetical protein
LVDEVKDIDMQGGLTCLEIAGNGWRIYRRRTGRRRQLGYCVNGIEFLDQLKNHDLPRYLLAPS